MEFAASTADSQNTITEIHTTRSFITHLVQERLNISARIAATAIDLVFPERGSFPARSSGVDSINCNLFPRRSRKERFGLSADDIEQIAHGYAYVD